MEEFLTGREPRDTTDYLAVDEVQNNTSWVSAASYICKKLDNACYEYSNCRLFVNAVIRMTFNESDHQITFSHGQVAVVSALADNDLPQNEYSKEGESIGDVFGVLFNVDDMDHFKLSLISFGSGIIVFSPTLVSDWQGIRIISTSDPCLSCTVSMLPFEPNPFPDNVNFLDVI